MRRVGYLAAVAIGLGAFAPAAASAAIVSDTQAYTSSGQELVFSFGALDGIDAPNGGGSLLISFERMDLSPRQAFEKFSLDVDGVAGDRWISGRDLDVAQLDSSNRVGTISGYFTFDLSELELAEILSDLSVAVSLDFTRTVGASSRSFVTVELSYESAPLTLTTLSGPSGATNVPGPLALPLIAVGVAALGFAGVRRRSVR